MVAAQKKHHRVVPSVNQGCAAVAFLVLIRGESSESNHRFLRVYLPGCLVILERFSELA